jgi:hypothetical protein
VRPVDFVTGAALVRAAALREVGLVDEVSACTATWISAAPARGLEGRGDGLPVAFSEGSSRRVKRRASYLSMRNSVRFYLRYRGAVAALRHAWGVLRIAVGAFALEDPHDIRHRYRPGRWWTNVTLWLGAMGWNVVHLTGTLWGRPRVTV